MMGDGVFGANAELRYKVFSMVIFNQNIYGALSTFFDTGIVTRAHQFDSNQVPDAFTTWVNQDAESWHHSAGIGVRGSLNQNFIVAFDYGRALDERDGESALYISLGWLF
ncbi:MAG: hemolysin activation/secretion protein [Cyclobacteriaceae bacterium]